MQLPPPMRITTGVLAMSLMAAACYAAPVSGAELSEPHVFTSQNGVLDLLIIAKAKPVRSIAFKPPGRGEVNPTAWVYEICPRPGAGNECPESSATASDYGGARLALQPGDVLKVRLVNRLPKLDAKKLSHAAEHGGSNLALNPTNLHTHGLIVTPRAASPNDPTFGDYVFVDVFNAANGRPEQLGAHQHSAIAIDYADYRIEIPKNHPSGLFWFHPHVHGLGLNQISSGLAGILTVGNVGDYARKTDGAPFSAASVRHLILKDMQVLSAGEARFKNGPAKVVDGEILSQQDPEFCAQTPGPGETRPGFCPGVDNSKKDGSNFTGGKWFFTVNGQVFPRIPVRSEAGEIWRLTNASGSVSYHLQLVDDGLKKPLVMQLIAVDGVTISLPQDTPKDTVVKLAGARFKTTPCQTAHTEIQSLPVCVTDLVMMPSSRAEVWVAYRDAAGGVTTQPAKATATLKTVGLTMGSGDAWPAVDLARVAFAQARTAPTDAAVIVQGDASKMAAEGGIFSAPAPDARARPLPAGCKALPAGHRRRIFFGLEDLKDEDSFGLGYEEVDEHGAPVPGTRLSVSRFDPSRPSVCLPLGPGQTPVHETWELVQLSTENHNFHIHQTKFRTVFSSRHGPSGMLGPTGFRIPQDNLPLGVAEPDASISKKVMDKQSGVCSVKQWRDGFCHSKPVVLDVPFSKVGDFVYHCHILEHEDGGMMAKIRVVPFPK